MTNTAQQPSLMTHTYEGYFDCVHCGLCLDACPTYKINGLEMDSPRGRIYTMRALAEGRVPAETAILEHLDLCLDCRACETACPSGVRYGSLIESMRAKLTATRKRTFSERLMDLFFYHVFPYPRRVWWALFPVRLMQWTGIQWLIRNCGVLRIMPQRLQKMEAMIPALGQGGGIHAFDEINLAEGAVRSKVAMFTGCAASVMFGPTNRATVRVLRKNGCEVYVPRSQVCCGAISYHGGQIDHAQQFAMRNITWFEQSDAEFLITNCAGCGAMLKEYDLLFHDNPEWHARAKAFSAQVRDVSEHLDAIGLIPPTSPIDATVTYHDACHLAHGQGVRDAPRNLLSQIPGLKLVPLSESDTCCGAAGTYNLAQPEMSTTLAQRKLAFIDKTGAQIVATGNAGCLIQIAQHARQSKRSYTAAHPIDLLDQAYD